MNKSFFVIDLIDENADKTKLKKWWEVNRGKSSKGSHALYFELLSAGWKSEVSKNEVWLISPSAQNGASIDNASSDIDYHAVDTNVAAERQLTDVNPEVLSSSFTTFIEAYNQLKNHGLLRNQKDITGQLGEWVASILLDAQIAENGINKDWDLKDDTGKNYQVKSHAKAPTTSARWSYIRYPDEAPIDFIIIVVFSENYQLQEFYQIPFKEAIKKRSGDSILNWSKVAEYKIKNLSHELTRKNLVFLDPNQNGNISKSKIQ